MLRIAIAAALALASASAYAEFNKCGRGICPNGIIGEGFPGGGGGGVPPVTGKILLADGVSFLLLTDGASKLCRAGGC